LLIGAQEYVYVEANGVLNSIIGGHAIQGISKRRDGVRGEASGTTFVGPGATTPGAGVFGKCTNWVGVYGVSEKHNGVHGESKSQSGNGVAGYNTSSDGGIGVFGYAGLLLGTGYRGSF